jgi:hypothetical protein
VTLNTINRPPIICKTVNYIDQSERKKNSFWHVVNLYTYGFSRSVADWSVKDMNSDMLPYATLLDVSVSHKKKDKTNI